MLALGLAAAGAGGPTSSEAALPDGFRDSLVIAGLDLPVGMAFLPDGRLLVIEQFSRRVRLVRNGAFGTPDPLFTVPQVQTGGERGLLGIAVDPGWPARPYLYFHVDDLNTQTIRITRYTVAGDLANAGTGDLTIDPATRRDILTGIPDQADNHNGGTVRFGPDGMLYVSLGEDAARCVAQDTLTLRGVILRLDVSAVPAGGGAAPQVASLAAAGNPLTGHLDPRSRLIWAWGLRNPFRFQIDPADGALFIGDVGQNVFEEIDRAATGGLDFGWPHYEALRIEEAGCALTGPHAEPIHAYDRTAQVGAAVISAGVYRRPAGGACAGCFPASYEGDFFFSDYYGGFLRRLTGSGSSWALAAPVGGQPSATTWATGFGGVSDFAIGPDGGLWSCHQGTGEIHALLGGGGGTGSPPPAPAPAVTFALPYPQPAPGSVQLSFRLESDVRVRLRIYDLRGARVRTLVDANRPAGVTVETWNGDDDEGDRLPAGLYVARLEAAGRTLDHRVVLVR